MSNKLAMIPASAMVEARSSGDLWLRNEIELAAYPANLLTWLRESAARFPDKPFLKERGADGAWVSITYNEMKRWRKRTG